MVGRPPRGSMPGTRDRILAAAADLFGEKSYAGTSVRDIAERLGITKAALYYYFPSKETILDALIDPLAAALKQLAARASATPTPGAEEIIEELASILVDAGAVFFAVATDPAVLHRRIKGARMHDCMDAIALALAGPAATPARLARARAAFGAIQGGVLGTAFALIREHAGEATDPTALTMWRSITEDVQREVVSAALAALGRPV
jgi:TetR/AcrR family transcriptional regulator, regulator of cefoperazone and chloramphenicol sensitivity